MKDLWNYLKGTGKPIVLYGMGNGADIVLAVCKKYGIKISGVFASEGFVRAKAFHGMPVTSYEVAKESFGDMIILLCFGTALPEVIRGIKQKAKENELYAPDVPVCGEEVFCAEYYEKRKREFENVYSLLCDGASKKTFENLIKFKLSGDINYLFACQQDESEPYGDFLKLGEDETYLDLGAYRGDTVLSFLKRAKGYKEIIAVEPDEKSYKKLCDAVIDIKNVRTLNAFAGEKPGVTSFNMNGSRGGGRAGAQKEINVISVDTLSVMPSFIKMDIEGAEAAAIRGARRTIAENRPKMQIAAYHRAGDLADIPKEVLSCREDYKIYLRHNPCLPAWDVSFFFI